MEELAYWGIFCVIFFSALGVVLMPNPIYSLVSLLITLTATAGLFVMLGAHFLALVQLILYAGAVVVLFLFILLLLDAKREKLNFATVLFFAVALILGGAFVFNILPSLVNSLSLGHKEIFKAGLSDFSNAVFSGQGSSYKWYINFEISSLLLLAGMLSAVMLSKRTKDVMQMSKLQEDDNLKEGN